MKLKIKVKKMHQDFPLPKIIDKGEWIDLSSAENVHIKHKGGYTMFSLGIAMQLPDGYEAIIAPRSSTPKKFGIIIPNSFGVIDSSYKGNTDDWKMIAYCIRQGGTDIPYGERVAQFRIQLSQKATVWQKIKWLFSSGIEFIEVDDLENKSRGGIGTTGWSELT